MSRVMFTSEHPLGRAENLRAVFDAYDGPKDFVRGIRHMRTAPQKGYSVVVCDSLPEPMAEKRSTSLVVINHGILGGKLYALDERRDLGERDFGQIDHVISSSTGCVPIASRMFGIPAERVLPLGMPRTDAYIGKAKGDGKTPLAKFERAYLYAPTYRASGEGRLPRIDWRLLSELLDRDECIAVKRHYFDREPLVGWQLPNVIEVEPMLPSAPWLMDCDVLLTDYSSIVLDGYVLGKPSVLAIDGMDAYMAARGMYMPYPGSYGSRWIVAEGHEAALLAMLRNAAEIGLRKMERECLRFTADRCDGHSTQRVCDLIRRLA